MIVERGRVRLSEPARGQPDALLSADAATWEAIASDVARGMDAFRRGRLQRAAKPPPGRRLPGRHLGDGRGQAGCGSGGCERRAGAFSIIEAGEGPPVLMLHGLGGTKASFLPSIAALAPSFRTVAVDMLGLRGLRQAARRLVRPRVPGAGGRATARRARAGACAHRGPQHGRPGGARAWLRAPRPHGRPRPHDTRDGLAARAPLGALPALGTARAGPDPGRPAGRGGALHAVADAGRRHLLGTVGDRRVRAHLHEPAGPGRLLRGGAQHLPRRAARRGRASGRGCARSRRSRSSSGVATTGWHRWPSSSTSRRLCRRRSTSSSTAAICRRSSARARPTRRSRGSWAVSGAAPGTCKNPCTGHRVWSARGN